MTRAAQAVAALAMVAMAACAWLLYEAGRRAYETIGPSKAVAAADGGLYVVSHGAVHRFDASGKRVGRRELAPLGVSRTPSDLAVHRDGTLVIADPEANRLVRCPPEAPCVPVVTGLHRAPGKAQFLHNSAKVHIDEVRRRYYVSDNAGHRLLAADFDGRRLGESVRGAVHYPNVLRLVAPDRLMVADTNHRRVAVFDVSGERVGRVVDAMPTAAPGVARIGRVWPFDAIRLPGGETWVLIAMEGMKDADLVVFDGAGVPRRRIDLGDDADPFAIEPWGGRIVVADGLRFRLDAVTPAGSVEPALGDAQFLRELGEGRERFHGWRRARLAAQAGLVIVPLLAILALWRLGVPLTGSSAPKRASFAPAPLAAAPHWLEPDPAFFDDARSSLRNALVAMGVVCIAFIGLMYALFGGVIEENPSMVLRMGLILALPLAAIALVPLVARQVEKNGRATRVGAALGGVHYTVPKSLALFRRAPPEGVVPWSEVYFDGRRLLLGRLLVTLRAPLQRRALFADAELGPWILAHLEPSHHVTPAQLGARMLRRSL